MFSRVLAIMSAAAGTLGLVTAWVTAITGWRKYGAEKTVLAVTTFLAAGAALWIMAIIQALHGSGHRVLRRTWFGGLVGLSIPIIMCLIVVIIIFTREKTKGSTD